MTDFPWISIALLIGFFALIAVLRTGLWNLAARTRHNPAGRSQAQNSRAYVRRPAPKTIQLGYIPAGPDTSYAPARWAFDPEKVREGRLIRLHQYLDRIAAIRIRIQLFEGLPPAGRVKIDVDRQQLIQQLNDSSQTLRYIIAKLDDEGDPSKSLVRAYHLHDWAERAFTEFCKVYGLQESLDGRSSAQDQSRPDIVAAEIERRFTGIFAMRTPADRERIVAYLMQNKGCDRLSAMKFAIEDWEKDNRSWR